jgi:glutamate synthase (ferredoxin)
MEARVAAAFRGQGSIAVAGLHVTTADRSLGAALTGAIERGEVRGPVRLDLIGAAGQSFGAFAGPGVDLRLTGQANDYLGKGLSGGSISVSPEADLSVDASSQVIAGNTALYGATGGAVHLVGRAGMRFAVRNSGAEAVVEGVGPHGCEYMTGGIVVVLGPVGANFGAGMTGGRAYLYDLSGRHLGALDGTSVRAIRLGAVLADDAVRTDGPARLSELLRLLLAHRDAGSALAAEVLDHEASLADDFWLVEPMASPSLMADAATPRPVKPPLPAPDRNPVVSRRAPTAAAT